MSSSLAKFRETISRLRDPENGCPWDLKQSHTSLKKYFLEEVYEFLHEVDENDAQAMEEELGDVLLKIYLHAHLLSESTAVKIDIESIAIKIDSKMIHRHPHVFDPDYQHEGKSVEEIWAETKDSKAEVKKDPFEEARNLPPLQKVERVYRGVKGQGFRFPDRSSALDKVAEELDEVRERLENKDEEGLKEEFGDLMLSIYSASMEFGYSPEELLQSSLRKFHSRWKRFSSFVEESEHDLPAMSYADILTLWTRSKHEL